MRKLREEGVDHSCFRLARRADRTTLRHYSPLCSIAYRDIQMYATVPNLRDDPPAAVLSVIRTWRCGVVAVRIAGNSEVAEVALQDVEMTCDEPGKIAARPTGCWRLCPTTPTKRSPVTLRTCR